MKHLLAALLMMATPVLAEDGHDHDAPAHAFEIGGLDILHPWTNATDHGPALLFMELHNEGSAPVEILGARLDSGVEGQLVGFRMKGGEMGFETLPPIPVAPDRQLALAPDGLAIRFDGLQVALEEGHHWQVILMTSAGELEIDVMIEADDARQHSHAGHSH
ncbi:copper chaperone PCu(A)C [Mameliella sp. CS4]|uniref:copper chaperone PCu(A)C n=1 Tax=Mameliella sp. CS4 TaxID=2862329 RepID=UPI001C5E19C3|nr:copper chaperone PCu(A)C [Mameliella sp. CS4]MBW4981317.1 copper chaperone PCu(A)C [Mameliella sp. CS4]